MLPNKAGWKSGAGHISLAASNPSFNRGPHLSVMAAVVLFPPANVRHDLRRSSNMIYQSYGFKTLWLTMSLMPTSEEHKELLRLLTLLNSSMRFVALRLKELSSSKILTADYIERLSIVTREVERYLNKSKQE